ncbi:uncharacterized protein LOC130836172 isoform X1 [Hippopotamus amphibius kiboko]|uniref:uncharacterized protein LOC130836172 isoform X1 n=1 Tax=Hippopotamus amphibius kiboko TaxID=575201 RepID=UPI0025987180|nr:uncharacterized protein LOC130836172 isoform X1 [Hippopotamus amphibius kiboko]XP_057564227.1 uncharacterized protein LOC130836172 isoform X1 [Hippopotamus amphibius kiboko]
METMVQRALRQGQVERRADDCEVAIYQRLETHYTLCEPILTFYQQKNLLRNILAEAAPENIFAKCCSVIERLKDLVLAIFYGWLNMKDPNFERKKACETHRMSERARARHRLCRDLQATHSERGLPRQPPHPHPTLAAVALSTNGKKTKQKKGPKQNKMEKK